MFVESMRIKFVKRQMSIIRRKKGWCKLWVFTFAITTFLLSNRYLVSTCVKLVLFLIIRYQIFMLSSRIYYKYTENITLGGCILFSRSYVVGHKIYIRFTQILSCFTPPNLNTELSMLLTTYRVKRKLMGNQIF